jgi:hypothetical protein
MSRKSLIYIGAFIGSIVGGYLPTLWGAGAFSGTSFLVGTIGTALGIWAAVKLT